MSAISDIFLNPIKNVPDKPASDVSGEGAATLAKMKNGDTFSAKVVNTSGENVTLRLSNGNLVNAKLSSDMNISEGQTVSFEIRNSGNSIKISPLLTNTSADISVLKALDQASLPVNDTSVAMTTEMMKAGLSIDRQSLAGMYESILNNPGAKISDAVDLAKLGLQINEANLSNIESYKNLSYQIDQGMQTIAEKTDQALMDLVSGGDTAGASKVMSSLIESVTSYMSETGDPLTAENALQSTEVNAVAQSEAVNAENGTVQGDAVSADEKLIAQADVSVREGAVSDAAEKASGDAAANVSGDVQDPASKALELLKAMQSGQSESKDNMPVPQNSESSVSGTALSDTGSQPSSITEDFSRAVEVFRQITGEAEYKPADLQNFLKDISAFQAKALAEGNTDGLRDLVSSKSVRNLIFDVLRDQWSISPSEVADKEKVEALYRRLGDQINILKDGLTGVNAQNTPAFQAADNMSSNLDFLNQINQMYAYIQLPLKLSGGDNAHGDLYVYSNRKNMTSDDSTVTAFMHLDMDHLGPVDVYVAMDIKSGGKVQTNFTVADDEILSFLEENIHILNERLNKRGYDLSCRMSLKGKEESPEEEALADGGVNLLLLHAGGMGGSFRAGMRSFDVRA
ncbi:MAG: flagellar hook-length control protein FliK [Lachnospiraceae bacterium]|nr:flagellar hook-length control protein FliK [Lachnospiraceae bacterium]